ncbi:MAG: winged helix-turn-helix domain-containing protein [Ignavibacteriales bacterium]
MSKKLKKIQKNPQTSRYEIVNEILRVVQSRNQSPSSIYLCKPLHIEYGAWLTYRQMHCYTTSLVESGFLKRKQTKRFDLRQYYEITDKGRHYMQIFGELENDMKPISDDPLKQNLII